MRDVFEAIFDAMSGHDASPTHLDARPRRTTLARHAWGPDGSSLDLHADVGRPVRGRDRGRFAGRRGGACASPSVHAPAARAVTFTMLEPHRPDAARDFAARACRGLIRALTRLGALFGLSPVRRRCGSRSAPIFARSAPAPAVRPLCHLLRAPPRSPAPATLMLVAHVEAERGVGWSRAGCTGIAARAGGARRRPRRECSATARQVTEIIVGPSGGRASGRPDRLATGSTFLASDAVVCNADVAGGQRRGARLGPGVRQAVPPLRPRDRSLSAADPDRRSRRPRDGFRPRPRHSTSSSAGDYAAEFEDVVPAAIACPATPTRVRVRAGPRR